MWIEELLLTYELLFRIHRKNFPKHSLTHTKWSKLIHFNVCTHGIAYIFCFSCFSKVNAINKWSCVCVCVSLIQANTWRTNEVMVFYWILLAQLCVCISDGNWPMHIIIEWCCYCCHWALCPSSNGEPNSYKLIALTHTHAHNIFMCCVIPASFHRVPPSIKNHEKKFIFVSAFFSTHPLLCSNFPTVYIHVFLLSKFRSLKMCCYQSRLITWHINFPFE